MKELKMFDRLHRPDTDLLDVAVGPHYRLGTGLAEIYQRWVMALLPAMAGSLFIFGPAVLRIYGLCVCFSVLFDFIAEKFAPSRDLTSNWSSVSLALLLAFMLPLNAPWWLIMIGCFRDDHRRQEAFSAGSGPIRCSRPYSPLPFCSSRGRTAWTILLP